VISPIAGPSTRAIVIRPIRSRRRVAPSRAYESRVRRRSKNSAPTARDHEGAETPFADAVGTIRERSPVMLDPTTDMAASATEQDLRPRARTLSWLASMSVAAGEMRAAEGYLLELLAWCAFADRDVVDDVTTDL